MNTIPDNSDDIIDSRDVIARIDDLESEREALQEAVDEAQTELDDCTAPDDVARAEGHTEGAQQALDAWENDEGEELATLRALADQCDGYVADWHHGETLIRDSYFEDYARELADDIGAISSDASWPNTCIDWEQAAKELQMDYTSVDFAGVTYWVR